jgi:hypothetical protein
LLLLSGFLALPIDFGGRLSAQEIEWKIYRNPEADFEIPYPADWQVHEAKERSGPGTRWEPEILAEGELHKTTFFEGGEAPWPGQYQIRVLANPKSLALEAVYSDFNLSDLWDGSEADTTLAGLPAKTWVRWKYDSMGREFLLVRADRVFQLLFDERSPNDPDVDRHRGIYSRMTQAFIMPSRQDSQKDSIPR